MCLAAAVSVRAADTEPYEQPPIRYSATLPNDAVSRLETRLTAGEIKFAGSDSALLAALLRHFKVPVESQMLVFSRTSLQRGLIRPDHPRAIYFTDDTYVGWVPGGLIEIVAIDPVLGPIFYSVDPARLRANTPAPFVRDRDCLRCHGNAFVPGIPGVFARSVFSDVNGELLLQHGSEVVDFRTPFENRWGGWYVTGKHGSALHRGNVIAQEHQDRLVVDFTSGANITDLAAFFPTQQYPAPGSDIVALLVMEHQTAMQNTLTRASLNARRMLEYQKNVQRELNEPVTEDLAFDSVRNAFQSLVQEITDDLLFHGEAPLPAGVEGSPEFQHAFQANVPRDADGHSLKEFSLKGRLFANRCSYLIYSQSFLQLPVQLKGLVYDRLARVFGPDDPDPRYAYLGAEERKRIARILRETHPELQAVLAPDRMR